MTMKMKHRRHISRHNMKDERTNTLLYYTRQKNWPRGSKSRLPPFRLGEEKRRELMFEMATDILAIPNID